MPKRSNDPLEGKTLEMILTELVDHYGWEYLGQEIRINCFNFDPSIKSSLTFLRRTPWARAKVEDLYRRSLSSLSSFSASTDVGTPDPSHFKV